MKCPKCRGEGKTKNESEDVQREALRQYLEAAEKV